MGIKLAERLETPLLIGVNVIPQRALGHPNHARHVVARIAEPHQVEGVQFSLHAGVRMGIPLFL